jgi:hypothetical protein
MFRRLVWTLFLLIPPHITAAQIQFHPPATVIEEPPIGGTASPCVREDDLEMFFESSGDIYRAVRSFSDVRFTSSLRVNEISTSQYLEERPFLSVDGLRIYFTRRLSTSKVREIYMATRETQQSTFGTPASVGPQGASPFEGSLGSLTGDEKKVYLEINKKVPAGSGTSLTEQSDIAYATRENTSQKFGSWRFLTGVNTLDYERDPFITRDDQMLFFTRVGPVSKLPGTILFSLHENTGNTFLTPEVVLGVNTANVVSEDPFLQYPGSRLYFRKAGELMVAERILEATYFLPNITGVPGRSVLYPVEVATREADAQQFNFRLFFDSIYLTWEGVVVAPDLGEEDLDVTAEGSGRLLVSLRTNHLLPNTGIACPILYFRFKIGTHGVAGQKRTFRLSTGPQVNGIAVDRPPDGSIQFLPKPVNPSLSAWRVW